MSHYTKLSIIFFRILGTLSILLGFMGVVYWLLGTLLGSTSDSMSSARGLSSIIFIFAGIIIYYLGKPISKIIGKDIDD